jgi:hypothetical protein
MWDWRRRRERRCPSCAAVIEFTVPAFPYYAFHFGAQIVGQVAPFALIFLFLLSPRWAAMALGVSFALFVGLTILSNYLFGRWAVLSRAGEIPSAEIAYKRRF